VEGAADERSDEDVDASSTLSITVLGVDVFMVTVSAGPELRIQP